jgi:hypothetical protein
MRTLEGGFYAAPPVAAFAGTMMIPYAGPALSYLAAEDFAYRDLRDNSIKAGTSELDASLFAEDWKSVVAVPQTLVERLQVLAPLGRLPMVNEALDAISRRMTSRVLSGVVKVGVINAAETGTEELQHVMPYAVQDLAHAFALRPAFHSCPPFGPVSNRRPRLHGGGGYGVEFPRGGSVAGLDGHALLEGEEKPGQGLHVGCGGEVAFLYSTLETGLQQFQ